MTKKFYFISPLVLFCAFLLDGQLATLVSNLLPGSFTIGVYLLMILGIYLNFYLPLGYSLFLFAVVGLVYDLYYFNLIGIAMTLFPLAIYFIYFFYQNLRFRMGTNLVILLVIVFFVECASFGLARLFHLTNLSLFLFVIYHLLPTLIFNLILLLGLHPFLNTLFYKHQ